MKVNWESLKRKATLAALIVVGFFVSHRVKGQFSIDSVQFDGSDHVRREYIIAGNGTKDELFSKAKIWLASNLRNSLYAIKTEDKAEGFIVVKSTAPFNFLFHTVKKKKIITDPSPWTDKLELTLTLFFKDQKAKLIFSDMTLINAAVGSLRDDFARPLITQGIKLAGSTDLNENAWGQTLLSKFSGVLALTTAVAREMELTLQKKLDNDF